VTLPLRVSKGMIEFMKDHATILQETQGTAKPQEYFEKALREDFASTVDLLHLNHEEIYRKYRIPEPGETENKATIQVPTEFYEELERDSKKLGLTVEEYAEKLGRYAMTHNIPSQILSQAGE
jgi:hypothetical protein